MAMSAIDTLRIKTLCNDIQDYSSKIQLTLKQVYDCLDNAQMYWKKDGSSDFNARVIDLQASEKNVINNMNTYIDDYNGVVNSYILVDIEASSQIKYNPEIKKKEEI